MKEIDKIIERIRRLLAMAEDSSSPNEAMIAAKRARSLMDKYQISKDDIGSSIDMQFSTEESNNGDKVRKSWVCYIAGSMGELNDCIPLVYKKPIVRYTFNGFKSDTIVAKLMFEYLLAIGKRLTKQIKGRSEKNSFLLGFSSGVNEQVKEILRERNELKFSNGRDLVVVKMEMVREHFGKSKKVKLNSKTSYSEEEYELYKKGFTEGKNVNLDGQIGTDYTETLKLA